MDVTPYGAALQCNDSDIGFTDYYTCTGEQNYSSVCKSEIDSIFTKQSQTLALDERKKLVNQMETLALKEYGAYALYWRSRFLGHSRRVRDLNLHPTMDNNRRLQDVWLAEK